MAVLRKFVRDPQIQKLVTKCEAADLDVIATYNGTGLVIGSDLKNGKEQEVRLAVTDKHGQNFKILDKDVLSHLSTFFAGRYTKFADDVAFLNQFNESVSKLGDQLREATGKIVNDFKFVYKESEKNNDSNISYKYSMK